MTGLDSDYLMTISYCARQVKPENRRIDVNWTIHYVLASLTDAEQIKWLDESLEKGYSVRELKEAMRIAKGIKPSVQTTGSQEDKSSVTITEVLEPEIQSTKYETAAKEFKKIAEDLFAVVQDIENPELAEIRMHYAEVLEEYNKIEQESKGELG